MKTIYVVTTGEYSDYQIVAIFDNKEQAEKFKDLGSGEHRIEKYKLNEFADVAERGLKPHQVRMDKEGNSEVKNYSFYYGDSPSIELKEDTETRYEGWKSYQHKTGKYTLHWQGYAKDEKHAVKIANEKRTQIIANNLWNQAGVKKYQRD